MDTSSAPLHSYGRQYQWCSDSDLSSVSSPETLSPVDSSLSPSSQRLGRSSPPTAARGLKSRSPSRPGRRAGKAARIRSKQRESASEKEKLRMRDLTKALHHLRTYLPPSVAPAGQNLTKIETLRLTIRYISHLSAQLGLSEEALFRRREQRRRSGPDGSPDILRYLQHRSGPEPQDRELQDRGPALGLGLGLGLEPGLGLGLDLEPGLDQPLYPSQCPSQTSFSSCGLNPAGPPEDFGLDAVLQAQSATPASCQMCSPDFCVPLMPREYWG